MWPWLVSILLGSLGNCVSYTFGDDLVARKALGFVAQTGKLDLFLDMFACDRCFRKT